VIQVSNFVSEPLVERELPLMPTTSDRFLQWRSYDERAINSFMSAPIPCARPRATSPRSDIQSFTENPSATARTPRRWRIRDSVSRYFVIAAVGVSSLPAIQSVYW
jgi:hypothetical protein